MHAPSASSQGGLAPEGWHSALFLILLLPVAIPLLIALVVMYRGSRARRGFAFLTPRLFAKAFIVWAFHQLGLRPDAPGARLFQALPGCRLFLLLPVAVWFKAARLLSGFHIEHDVHLEDRGVLHMAMSRLAFFDQCLAESDVEQIVIVGGELTSYAYNLAFLPKRETLQVFEVNDKRVHKAKQRLVRAAKVPHHHVEAVLANKPLESNFDWVDDLERAGFSPQASTLFLLDAQIQYWHPEFAEAFMDDIVQIMDECPSSRIAFDYVDETRVERGASGLLRWLTAPPWRFGLPDDEQEEWVEHFGGIRALVHERVEAEQSGYLLCGSARARRAETGDEEVEREAEPEPGQ